MKYGVLLFAVNNSEIDYIKQAIYCAKKVKEHLDLPIALATDSLSYLNNTFPFYKKYIDLVINIDKYTTGNKKSAQGKKIAFDSRMQTRKFFDGAYTEKTLVWRNHSRAYCYDISPFEETLVIDVDFLVCNNDLLNCFKLNEDFLIYKDPIDIFKDREFQPFNRVSDKSIDLRWATAFYFKKNKMTEAYFDLVKHIRENWGFYKLIYQIPGNLFRNDFAFSIAIHILNGFQSNDWPKSLPGNMYTATDKDVLYEIKNNKLFFVIEASPPGSFRGVTITDSNVHVMNKFSLSRMIDIEFENE